MKKIITPLLLVLITSMAHAVQIDNRFIKDKTITSTKIDSTGSTSGQSLTSNGSGGATWTTSTGGGGGVGVNLTMLDSSYALSKQTNSDANTSVGDWIAYSNTAGVAPVNMTGGSPNSTVTRSTSSPLNGSGSFLLTVNSGASRQGEGASLLVNVAPGYRGNNVQFNFPFQTTGTIVEDDFRLYAYAVDGATAGIITPFTSAKILGSSGIANAIFPIASDTTQVRIGIHIARTSTGAATIKFDDVILSSQITPVGLAGSDWQSYTLVIGGSTSAPTEGTGVTKRAKWRRVGDSMQIMFNYAQTGAGSDGSGTYLFPLPEGSIDTAKLSVGTANSQNIVGFGQSYTANPIQVFPYNNTNLALVAVPAGAFGSATTVGSSYSNMGNATQYYSFVATIPIAGWSSNVQMANSAQFNLSSYLATGTRVTSTPTLLGQYRAYQKNSSAATGSDAAPNTLPSASDGMAIGAFNYATAGSGSFNISRYEFFIGQNKHFKTRYFSATGKTGGVDATVQGFNLATAYGVEENYDPTTGVLTLDCIPDSATTTTAYLGTQAGSAGAAASSIASGYVDVVVSENALAVGSDNSSTISNALNQRIEFAVITNNGSSCVNSSQSGSWLSGSNTRNGTGDCTIGITSGMFSSPPICICSNYTTGGGSTNTGFCKVSSDTNNSTTQQRVGMTNGGNSMVDTAVSLMCMGSR